MELSDQEKVEVFRRLRLLDRIAGGLAVLAVLSTVLWGIMAWQLTSINQNLTQVAVLDSRLVRAEADIRELQQEKHP